MGRGHTAPCAGYCRASAMWSEESLTGRASRAVRNVLQKASSDMMDGCVCSRSGVRGMCVSQASS
jgi:hypothetical protein